MIRMIRKQQILKKSKGDFSIKIFLALVIGILLLGVVIYTLFFHSKEASFDCKMCASKFTQWCQECVVDNWGKDPWDVIVDMKDDLKDCKEECLGITDNECPQLKEMCRRYVFVPD